jgi:hypothetical protein
MLNGNLPQTSIFLRLNWHPYLCSSFNGSEKMYKTRLELSIGKDSISLEVLVVSVESVVLAVLVLFKLGVTGAHPGDGRTHGGCRKWTCVDYRSKERGARAPRLIFQVCSGNAVAHLHHTLRRVRDGSKGYITKVEHPAIHERASVRALGDH